MHERIWLARSTSHSDNSAFALANVDPSGLVLRQRNRVGIRDLAADHPQHNLTLVDVCPAGAGLVNFHAELGSEVRNGGRGSANEEERRGERGERRGNGDP
jgi:hypothetical protein